MPNQLPASRLNCFSAGDPSPCSCPQPPPVTGGTRPAGCPRPLSLQHRTCNTFCFRVVAREGRCGLRERSAGVCRERAAVWQACWGGCIGRNVLLTPPPCSPRQFAASSALSPNSRSPPAGTASRRRLGLTALHPHHRSRRRSPPDRRLPSLCSSSSAGHGAPLTQPESACALGPRSRQKCRAWRPPSPWTMRY